MLRSGDSNTCEVANNHCDVNNRGIELSGSDDCVVIGNIVTSSTQDGIKLNSCDNNIINGNISKDNDVGNTTTYSGIFLLNSDNNIISSNRCENNDNFEIDISAADCNKNILIGNICIGSDHVGAINDAGTNTHPNGASGTTNLALDDLNIIA